MMPNGLVRLSIHHPSDARGDADAPTVDVALPSEIAVAELMPALVRACGAHRESPTAWQLCALGGQPLDHSTTLAHNDVRDGDMLLLTTDAPLGRYVDAASVTTALAAEAAPPTDASGLRLIGCLWFLLCGALLTCWAGLDAQGPARHGIAAAAAVALLAGTVIADRAGLAAGTLTTVGTAAVSHVAGVGFLTVPGGPGAANVFLGAVAAASAAVFLARTTRCGPAVLTALAAVSVTVAVATGCAVIWQLSGSALGGVLIAAAIIGLTVAPRLAIAAAGLTPSVPREHEDDADRPRDADPERGRALLAGLVTGTAAAAAAGALLVAVGVGHAPTPAAAVLTAVTAVALTLRSRSYVSCRIPLTIAGIACTTVTLALIALRLPGSWAGPVAALTGLSLLFPPRLLGPAAARVADALEYTALAAVIPLTCWLAGLFDIVGGSR